MRHTTILSHTSTRLKTVRPLGNCDYREGAAFKDWKELGATEMRLDRDELRIFLAAVPPEMLLEALAAQGWTGEPLLTVDLDDTPQSDDEEPVPTRLCPEAPSEATTHIAHLAEQALDMLDGWMASEPRAIPDNPFFGLDGPPDPQALHLAPCSLCDGARQIPGLSWSKGMRGGFVACPACAAWPMPSGSVTPPREER